MNAAGDFGYHSRADLRYRLWSGDGRVPRRQTCACFYCQKADDQVEAPVGLSYCSGHLDNVAEIDELLQVQILEDLLKLLN